MAADINLVYRHIEEHMDESIGELKRLVASPSISAQGIGMQETANLVAQMMQEAGLRTWIYETGGAPVVYGEIKGATDRTLLFYDHYDVQPPEPLDLWESEPFAALERGGLLYGRGVADNKGNLVSRLSAIKAIRAITGELPVTVKFIVEGEEEIGSPHLAPFVESHVDLLRADGCIWETGGVNWEGEPLITLGLKGILYVELECRSALRDSHSAGATVIPNAAWRLVWALNTLKDQNEQILIDGFYDDVREPTEAELELLKKMPSEEEATLRSLGIDHFLLNLHGFALKKRELFAPTCTICGIVSGYTGPGTKTVLPSVARAKVDFRLVPDMRPEDIVQKLRSHLDRHGFSDVEIAGYDGGNPARTPVDDPFVQMVAGAAGEAYGREPIISPTMAGSGPMYAFTHTLGLPVASSGAGYPDTRVHAPNENIRLADYTTAIKHAATIIMRMGEM